MTGNTTQSDDRVAELEAQILKMRTDRVADRQRIIDTAQKYARAHNLCEVVDRALREGGVFGRTKTIAIEAIVAVKVKMAVDEEVWDTLTEEQRKEELAKAKPSGMTWETTGVVAVTSIANGNLRVVQPSTTIEKIEIISAEEDDGAIPNNSLPSGFVALYTYPSGRVQHVVRYQNNMTRNFRTLTYGGQTISVPDSAVCGHTVYTYGNTWWQETSPRAEGRYCNECANVMRRNHNIELI